MKESNFKKRVLEAVKKISKGKVLSYQEVAKLSGSPKAYRTVGNLLNKNRNSSIPCHRVIRSNGRLGGYNQGAKKKNALLRKESVLIKNRRLFFDKRD